MQFDDLQRLDVQEAKHDRKMNALVINHAINMCPPLVGKEGED